MTNMLLLLLLVPSNALEYSGRSWMTSLPEYISSRPITTLAIPGSHDSFTSYLNVTAPFAQNTDQVIIDIINKFEHTEKIAKRITKNWGITQNVDISTQLSFGIRYIDIRVMRKIDDAEKQFWTAHSLYAVSVESILEAARDFVRENPGEVVFLDMNHFYEMNVSDHEDLHSLIISTLQDDLFTGEYNFDKMSLNDIRLSGNIVVIYQDSSYSPFVPGSEISSPWSNTQDPNSLINFLDTQLLNGRPDGDLYVSQGVNTPDGNVIAHQPFKGLQKWESSIITPFSNWILCQHADDKVHGVNFVITDFITEEFVNQVVYLNYS